ncbi:MAG: GGDEF domain-containing protein [Betaproteobacteria bacterium]|jgi:diguanylate cyclase (GGDEF)-like protein
MPELIQIVADMTGHRDRDLIDATVAEVLFRLLKVPRLAWWRLVDHPEGARLRLMADLAIGQPVAMADPRLAPEDLPLVDSRAGFAACIADGVPRIARDEGGGADVRLFPIGSVREAIGLLEIESPERLCAEKLELIDGLLRIHRNHLALLDYSEHDTLTGLLNRKTFDYLFARRAGAQLPAAEQGRNIRLVGSRRATDPRERTWLAVVDIDFFKRINDRFGHLFGDEVLLLIARLMRSVFRGSDTLFRFGGEEFVVLLSLTDELGARAALERFRLAVETFPFPRVGKVTVSVGFTCAAMQDSPQAAFERADEALYYAKQNGRNRMCSYETLRREGLIAPRHLDEGEVELF